jgi:hypothetical protein
MADVGIVREEFSVVCGDPDSAFTLPPKMPRNAGQQQLIANPSIEIKNAGGKPMLPDDLPLPQIACGIADRPAYPLQVDVYHTHVR